MARREVKVPTGELRTIEVPDDWSDEKFSEEMKKAFPPGGQSNQESSEMTPQQETPSAQPQDQNSPSNFGQSLTKPRSFTQSLKEVGADALDALSHGVAALKRIPGNLEKSGKDLEKHPLAGQLHILGQLGAGAAGLAKGTANLPYDTIKYLEKKGLALNIPIPGTNWKTSDLIPHIPEDTGVEKALGLEAQSEKGDEAIRMVPNILSTGAGIVGGWKALSQVLSKPSKQTLIGRAIDDKIDAFAEKHALDKKETEMLKNSLAEEYSAYHGTGLGELTPSGQQVAINKKKIKIAEKEPLTQIPEKEVGEIPPPPDTEAIISEYKKAADQALDETKEALGVKDNPKLKGGIIVQKAIKDLHKAGTDLYNSIKSHYVDHNVRANNTAEIKKVTSELEALKNSDDLAPGYGSGTETQKGLEAKLESLKGETVAASDIYTLYRSLETMAKNARNKQFSEGGRTQLQRDADKELARILDKHADNLATQLEEVGGEDVRSMVKKANKVWRTYKQVKRNTTGKKALKKGELSKNTIENVENTESGNEFLQALMKNDPSLKQHILATYIGHKGINDLLNPTDLVSKYLSDPALNNVQKKVIAMKKALTTGMEEGKTKAATKMQEFKDLKESMIQEAKDQKIRQDAIKDTAELNKQIEFHKAAIPKIQKRIDIEEANGRSSVSLKKEKKQHERDMQDKKGKIKKLARLILSIKGIQGFSKKFGL